MKKEILRVEKVMEAIISWNIRFREAVRNSAELTILAQEYFEDLTDENVSVKEFSYAYKNTRRRCNFFPKMCDVLKYVEEYRKNPPVSDSLQLPEHSGHEAPMTDKQAEIMRKRINILAEISAKTITHEQGAIKMENL
jgi:hypothetical protein